MYNIIDKMKFLKRKKLNSLLISFLCVCFIYVSYQILFALKLTEYFREDLSDRVSLKANENSAVFAVPRVSERKNVNLNKTFRCDGFTDISYSQVNDDFCDCLDGTDETETSACPNGVFLCRMGKKISSSLVNDGICDCCDGSDEYKNLPSPIHLPLEDQKKSNVYLSPCSNKCSARH